jgi:hypothetical protein
LLRLKPRVFWSLILTMATTAGTIESVRLASAWHEHEIARPIREDFGIGPFYHVEDEPPKRLPKGTSVHHPLLEAVRRDWVPEAGAFPIPEAGWQARMAALCGFAREGTRSVSTLVSALDDADPRIRSVAAQALGIIGDPSVAGTLDAMLFGDPNGECRVYAAYARSMVGGMTAGPMHQWCLTMDRLFAFRAHLNFALDRGPDPLAVSVRAAYASYDLSRMNTARVGELAPDFELPSITKRGAFRLSDWRGKSDVLLIFIYGST